eukprot:162008-Chlamydomonas_euryale.AAC.7
MVVVRAVVLWVPSVRTAGPMRRMGSHAKAASRAAHWSTSPPAPCCSCNSSLAGAVMEGLGKGIVGGLLFEMKSWARYLLPTKYFAVCVCVYEYLHGRIFRDKLRTATCKPRRRGSYPQGEQVCSMKPLGAQSAGLPRSQLERHAIHQQLP